MSGARNLVLRALTTASISRIVGRWSKPQGTVFYFHRFASSQGTLLGHKTAYLRSALESLRAANIDLVNVDDLVERASSRVGARRPTVAFSIDDGYRDFVDEALPVFEAYDCPTTLYVVPGVIDGECWFWWDQLEWIVRHADPAHETLSITIGAESFPLTAGHSELSRQRLATAGEALKRASDTDLRAAIMACASAARLALPQTAPANCAVSTWEALREVTRRGVRIGAHTMSHPILSRCEDAHAEFEIRRSKQRVAEEIANPSLVFCYPNGSRRDFGARDMTMVREAGFVAAVSTDPGHVSNSGIPDTLRWRLPRYANEERHGATSRAVLLP